MSENWTRERHMQAIREMNNSGHYNPIGRETLREALFTIEKLMDENDRLRHELAVHEERKAVDEL